MTKLPILSGRELVGRFEKFGWRVVRQRGSHIVMVKEGHPATLSIPSHPEVARGTLRALVRAAGLRVEDVLRD